MKFTSVSFAVLAATVMLVGQSVCQYFNYDNDGSNHHHIKRDQVTIESHMTNDTQTVDPANQKLHKRNEPLKNASQIVELLKPKRSDPEGDVVEDHKSSDQQNANTTESMEPTRRRKRNEDGEYWPTTRNETVSEELSKQQKRSDQEEEGHGDDEQAQQRSFDLPQSASVPIDSVGEAVADTTLLKRNVDPPLDVKDYTVQYLHARFSRNSTGNATVIGHNHGGSPRTTRQIDAGEAHEEHHDGHHDEHPDEHHDHGVRLERNATEGDSLDVTLDQEHVNGTNPIVEKVKRKATDGRK